MKRRDEIRLSAEERDAFLALPRACTLATIGPSGHPQLTAMWYALLDGQFCFATYAKSQKVKNLERNPKCSVLVEDGTSYGELRGYSVEGEAELLEDAELAYRVLAETSRRYMGMDVEKVGAVMTEALKKRAEKRTVIRVKPEREKSWDHRKLGGSY
jgi:PPOX class probable F420-dependent enzyme